jgi:thioredoxin reductase
MNSERSSIETVAHSGSTHSRNLKATVPAMTTAQQKPQIPLNTIKVSDKAGRKVREFAVRDGKDTFGLKVAVKGGGCSGLVYVLEIVDGPDPDATVIRHDDGQEV